MQANDLESTIASLQQKCDLLSVELKDLQHSYSWKLQEREDVESYLMRLLSGKETELQDLRNRWFRWKPFPGSILQSSTSVMVYYIFEQFRVNDLVLPCKYNIYFDIFVSRIYCTHTVRISCVTFFYRTSDTKSLSILAQLCRTSTEQDYRVSRDWNNRTTSKLKTTVSYSSRDCSK